MDSPIKIKQSERLAAFLPIITVALVVIYAAAAYFLLLLPKITPLVRGGELDLKKLESQVADASAYASSLDKAVADFKMVNPERKQGVINAIPDEPDAPGIFVQTDAIAKGHDLVLTSIDTAEDDKAVTVSGRKTIRTAINVTGGTYEQFKLFLADIEHARRLMDVQTVVFAPETANYGLVLRAYYLDKDAVASAATPAIPGAEAAPAANPVP